MHVGMTGVTEHQRLAAARGHDLDPPRFRPSASLLKVAEMPDVMHFNPIRGTAQFARSRQQALEEVRTVGPYLRRLVVQDGPLSPLQRNAAPGGDQWLLPCAAFRHDLEALAWTVGRV